MGFHRQLKVLRADLGAMCDTAGGAVSRATRALLDVDADEAHRVVCDVDRLRLLHNAVERRTLGMLARQAPVAGDLRTVVTSIHIAADADRMGGLASHVAKVCLRRVPETAVPDEMRETFRDMGRIATELAECCRDILVVNDCALAEQIQRGDQMLEIMHQELFRTVMSSQWSYGPVIASDVVLLGRFYGRFADHADEIARRMIFQTGGGSIGHQNAI